MRRGQTAQTGSGDEGWSKQELLDASGLSAKTFDTIRKASRVRGPNHGGLNWMFTVDDLIQLVRRAESGSFSERGGPAAAGWRTLLRERGVELPTDRKR